MGVVFVDILDPGSWILIFPSHDDSGGGGDELDNPDLGELRDWLFFSY